MAGESHIPEGSVVITPAQVYAEVVRLTEAVNKLVVKDESDPLPARVDALEAEVRGLGGRLTSVERKLYLAAGAAAALGGLAGNYLPGVLGS